MKTGSDEAGVASASAGLLQLVERRNGPAPFVRLARVLLQPFSLANRKRVRQLRQPLRQTGLTLIELLMALAIGASLFGCALPVYSRLTSVDEVRAVADSLADALRLARVEAIRRNEPVKFTLEPASRHWSITQMNEGSVVRSSSAQQIDAHVRVATVPSNAVSVVFGPLGISIPAALDAPNIEELSVFSTTAAPSRSLRIKIEAVKIRVCDPARPFSAQGPQDVEHHWWRILTS